MEIVWTTTIRKWRVMEEGRTLGEFGTPTAAMRYLELATGLDAPYFEKEIDGMLEALKERLVQIYLFAQGGHRAQHAASNMLEELLKNRKDRMEYNEAMDLLAPQMGIPADFLKHKPELDIATSNVSTTKELTDSEVMERSNVLGPKASVKTT